MRMMMTGDKAPQTGIQKSEIALGAEGRVAVLSPNVMQKNLAFDPVNKLMVDLTQEESFEFRMNTTPYYFLLVARLDTDREGNVISPKISQIEYIRLNAKNYDEYLKSLKVIKKEGKPNILALELAGNPGYESLKVTATLESTIEYGYQKLADAIKALRQSKDKIAGMWQMLDMATGMSGDEYRIVLAQKAQEAQGQIHGSANLTPVAQQRQVRSNYSAPTPQQLSTTTEVSEGSDWDAEDAEATEIVDEPAPTTTIIAPKTDPKKATPKKEAVQPATNVPDSDDEFANAVVDGDDPFPGDSEGEDSF